MWCNSAGGTLYWRRCVRCDRFLDGFRQLGTEVAENWVVWSRIVAWRTWTNCCRLRVGVLILCGIRLWVRESIVRCWYVQCSGKEAECGDCGQRGVGKRRWVGSV